MANNSTPRKIELYVEELQRTLLVASLNYDIWWFYKEKNNRARYIKVMNKYSLFFRSSIHAHFVALVIALYRFFETRSDTYNIKELIKLLKETNQLKAAHHKEFNDRYKELKPLWRKISDLRSNVFAHRNNKYSVEEIFKKTRVTPNHIKKLLDSAKNLLNDITQKWNNTTYAFNLLATDDTMRLLTDLESLNKIRTGEDRNSR